MLARMREAVCKIWEIAKVLDSKGIGNAIPFIPEEGNIRYAMKGETIVMLYDIVGVGQRQNEKQIEYLRYVLHAPVKYEEQDSYKQWIRNDTVIRNNPMLPYFAMIDRKMGSDLAELYLEFQALMVIGYMKCCDKISAEMGMRYMTYMKNAIVLSEKALGKTINFDPLKLIDADMRDDVGNLYKFIQQFETKNIPYENNLNALDNLLNGGENIGCENSERNYREFYRNIEALALGEDCEMVEDEEETQEIIFDENSIRVDEKVLACVRRYFEGEVMHKNKNFGNARMVRNYFEAALVNQANRLASKGRITDTMLCSFIKDDLPKKFFVEN